LWQIYSGLYVEKFIRIALFCRRCDKNILVRFPDSQFQLPFTYKTQTLSFTT